MPYDPSLDPLRQVAASRIPDGSTLDFTGAYHPEQPDTLAQSTAGTIQSDYPAIAGYVIINELARGGMGRILTGRELALDREVAIKILLPGSDASRFITEARVTAKLPHPSIPPVYALGTLSDGSPYLAMKLVRGKTLAAELKSRPEPIHELPRFLQIFEQIAQAVGFAHSQGIIHRDLKPANIMVGAFGEVQVMDWGLSKELGKTDAPVQFTAATPESGSQQPVTVANTETPNQQGDRTRSGAVLGTPNYMAPEQARGELADARADVFALGGILCSILTGKAVFGGASVLETVKQAAAGETTEALGRLKACGADSDIVQLAEQCLAVSPSERPADGREVAAAVAVYRACVETRLRQIETERAGAAARDIEQRKRQRFMWMAAGLVGVLLVAGMIGVGIAAAIINKKNSDLTQSNQELEVARDNARNEAADTEAFSTFLVNQVLATARPQGVEGGLGINVTVKAALVEAEKHIDEVFRNRPKAEAVARHALGQTWGHLEGTGFAKAEAHFRRAIELRSRTFGPNSHAALQSQRGLAAVIGMMGRFDESLKLHQSTTAALESTLGPDHLETMAAASDLGWAYLQAGKLEESVELLEKTWAIQKKKLGPDHNDTLSTMESLVGAYKSSDRHHLATPLIEEVVAIRKAKFGLDHHGTLQSMEGLAMTYTSANRFDLAIPLQKQLLEAVQKKYGPDHPATLAGIKGMAMVYRSAGKLELALPFNEQLLASSRKLMGDEHPDTTSAMNGLGVMYKDLGRMDLALPLLEGSLKIESKRLGSDHQFIMISKVNLASAYYGSGKKAEAIQLLEEAASSLEGKHFQVGGAATIMGSTCNVLERENQLEKAEAWRRKYLAALIKQHGKKHFFYASELAILGKNLLRQRKFTEAEQATREADALHRQLVSDPKSGIVPWQVASVQAQLGSVLQAQMKYVEAEPLLLQGYATLKQNEKTAPPKAIQFFLLETLSSLIQLYTGTNQPEEVKKWRAEKEKLQKSGSLRK